MTKPILSPSVSDREAPLPSNEEEWRAKLTSEQYRVAREGGTERAFTGVYWNHWEPGKYCCIGCNTPLFDSSTKFDAGCGWPSYFAPITEHDVKRLTDSSHGMTRIEVRCAHCNSHLGHVFEDGPYPSGERFCINAASLQFTLEAPTSKL
jgi:peptide-methionine (R)-S-oxide reductase